ncbi:hypothetical protein EDC01DRAFT_743904 [Geopyxis carbonaria]|nr:hypothetical protein EDC01DRAFT_743904 [Geopyxis carbonaria]
MPFWSLRYYLPQKSVNGTIWTEMEVQKRGWKHYVRVRPGLDEADVSTITGPFNATKSSGALAVTATVTVTEFITTNISTVEAASATESMEVALIAPTQALGKSCVDSTTFWWTALLAAFLLGMITTVGAAAFWLYRFGTREERSGIKFPAETHRLDCDDQKCTSDSLEKNGESYSESDKFDSDSESDKFDTDDDETHSYCSSVHDDSKYMPTILDDKCEKEKYVNHWILKQGEEEEEEEKEESKQEIKKDLQTKKYGLRKTKERTGRDNGEFYYSPKRPYIRRPKAERKVN